MKRPVISILVVVVLVSSLGAGTTLAQEGDNTSTTPTETPGDEQATNTTTENETATDEQSDDSDEDLASKLWKVYRDDKEKTQAGDNEIYATLGPNSWVTGVEFEKEAEVAKITITTQRTVSPTFADASAKEKTKAVSYIPHQTETIPRGTYTIYVPATVAQDDNQMVCISGTPKWPCLSNGISNNNDYLGQATTVGVALAGILAFLIGLLLRVGYKVYRKQETGHPESMDGTTIESSRVGVKSDE